ncbi:hypothetical protein INR49_022286 [Caranx melampygus]|nr:hypothetical protein INR49_022286 [Caranx melampygus]
MSVLRFKADLRSAVSQTKNYETRKHHRRPAARTKMSEPEPPAGKSSLGSAPSLEPLSSDPEPDHVCLIPIHQRPDLLVPCADLVNSEWRRSQAARVHSLQKSSPEFPVCLILLQGHRGAERLLGHARLSRVVGHSSSLFVESVVVSKAERGRGYGRTLMERTERYAKRRGFRRLCLTTHDKQHFYAHLGYVLSTPVQNAGTMTTFVPMEMLLRFSRMSTGQVLQDHPFVVVWNIPTAHCHKRYDVHLNLGDFDIVENHHQSFQGQNVTIFYRNHLGMYPYLSKHGRRVNGGVPQLGDLATHLALSEGQLSGLLQPDFSGFGIIDWEEWRPLWARNYDSKMAYRRLSKELVRKERPDLTSEAVKALARQRFEQSARRFMEETLQMALRGYPKGFWGFYGFPACFNKHNRKQDRRYTGRCHRGTRRLNNRLSWLWSQSTALYPSVYLPQRMAGSKDAALMVRHRLLEALRVAALWHHGSNTSHSTPVFPYSRLAFTHSLTFLNQTDLVHTLGESASLGAAGVVLWGDLKFAKSKRQCILLRDYILTVLGPFIRSLRSDTLHCSRQLCHGNGRCTRRIPTSGHMISSVPAETSDPHECTNIKLLHTHFMCQCYPGWSGEGCQEETKNNSD